LFRRIDAEGFEALDHNPVALLGKVDQARLEELLDDDGFLAHLDRVEVLFDIYMNASTWYQEKLASGSFGGVERGARSVRREAASRPAPRPLRSTLSAAQYTPSFPAEFGISESLPIYSGGLGVLAGDHLKAASDLGIPLVGVGLAYREGYFRQY